jgi:transposase
MAALPHSRRSLATGLCTPSLSDAEFTLQATTLNTQLMTVMREPSPHLGIRRLAASFRINAYRFYDWPDDRRVPAENNPAERDIQPTVIARKVSFSSQSDVGTHTRGVLMSVRHTLKKRQVDVVAHLKGVEDGRALKADCDRAAVRILHTVAGLVAR